ncbi:MAG: CoB--CoM heterodisulfide reductase iron-sulfur subunit A family protein [Candidatus Thermoplasmatota archaeon]|nr:CoB--CoM heterodisulfide reductase iron-sulfur subunit A family protein [Candidatus Thermoplasmatota archaeon]
MKEKEKDVLVIGGGISGVQSALDLADKGYEVVIVDIKPSIGGNMVKLDKTFPTDDCSICISAPKLVETSRHENIELLTYSEIKDVSGSAGEFTVDIWKRSKYVDPEECTACADCAEVCPVEVPNEFDEDLSSRKAIYVEYPQSVPLSYTIDYDNCVGCGACESVCDAEAIHFLEKSKQVKLDVGSIIVATGYEMMEPDEWREEYGYDQHEDVMTALEYERLLSSSGPTEGEVLKPSDGEAPEEVAWIQCVGSRCKQKGMPYCSRVCCMYATKEASITIGDNPDIDASVHYMDLRAYGKDFQQYYQSAKEKGVNYKRGRPSRVYKTEEGKLAIEYEDTEEGEVKTNEVDMVVLSSAIVPSEGNKELADLLGVEVDENGFFESKDVLTAPMDSTRDGIYLAGCSQSPKDIPDSVAQASGAAARAVETIKDRERKGKPEKPEERDITEEEPRIGIFVCHCGKNIANYLDIDTVKESVEDIPEVKYVDDPMFACSEDAQSELKEAIEEHDLNRFVISACSPRTHADLFKDTLEEVGLNRYLLEMANIRNQCSWVHSDEPEKATEKAKRLTKMAVAKAKRLAALEEKEIDVGDSTVIIGGGPAGMKTALSMADAGQQVTLIEKKDDLGGKLNRLNTLFPSDMDADELSDQLSNQIENQDNITVKTSTEVEDVDGYIGNYELTLDTGEVIESDTIVLTTGFEEIDPDEYYMYEDEERVLTQLELDEALADDELDEPENVVFINCVGAMEEERPWCCRVGCGNSLKNAKAIKEKYPDSNVYVLYKDMRVFGKKEEEYYAEVQEENGVIFVRYSTDNKPEVTREGEKLHVNVHDNLLDEDIDIDTDYLVLAMQLKGDPSAGKLQQMLKLSSNPSGFFMEAHAKLRPLEFPSEGVYLAGGAHYPKNISDTLSQADGAASKAEVPMMRGYTKSEGIIAEIDDDRCSGCKMCISVCPYGAIDFNEEDEIAEITDVLCKGCGSCASVCPTEAITQKGFENDQLSAMIKSALLDEVV